MKIRTRLRGFLPDVRKQGVLSFEKFGDVKGTVVVDVAWEEELALVEAGSKKNPTGNRWWGKEGEEVESPSFVRSFDFLIPSFSRYVYVSYEVPTLFE